MDFYDYCESEFEPFPKSKKAKKKSKKRKKLFKKLKKFFKRFRDKVIDMALSTFSKIIFDFFDKKFEKAFA